jgi:hypothetical protein
MTTINVTNSAWIPLVKTYTGTADQPDVISIFLKSNNEVKIVDEQITNSMGYSPLNFITAIPRMKKAVKIIFQEIAQRSCFKENSEFWNAFKNLTRSIVQLVPLLGNATLYIHDKLRTNLHIHPKIAAELSNQQDVFGVAFDGKPVFSMPLRDVKFRMRLEESRSDDDTLIFANYLWHGLKKDVIDRNSQVTTRQLAEKMHRGLQGASFV